MTLSTLDADGLPDTRVLLLKEVTGSRVASLASRQSEVLDDPADLEQALIAAEHTVRADPGTICANHTVYAVTPASVEFWQGDAQRRHVRLRYRRTGDSWVKELLWP